MALIFNFYYQDVDYRIPDEESISQTVDQIIQNENRTPGEISAILMSDGDLLEMNKKYLGHDYYTDIITFEQNEGDLIEGELYISIDRVKDNALKFGESVERELKRVVFHGVLHLVGYGDKTDEEISLMREREDFYLNLQA